MKALVYKIAIGLALGLALFSLWSYYSLQLTRQELATTKEALADRSKEVEFLNTSLQLRDKVALQTAEREGAINAQLQRIYATVSKYKSQTNSASDQCLGLVPSPEFLEWVRRAEADPKDKSGAASSNK
ncbi:putative spanin Rz-like protein [Pseudomonas phage PaMx41]|uniref:Putative spanin Rz-like protein n=1 Tax=Pseudomonas phage PaMx41 TaxID=1815976 RepID=A0A1C8HRW2_BPPP4|nr:Rz-like spanin [Pseudomonas phage PaMx41]ANA48980.1 putative spanin Rz-like protein [Pseudomonas phage PaMx41]